MDETTFKILNELTSDLGSYISINRLKDNIKKRNRIAHYKSIYDKIKYLQKNNDIILDKIGKSYIINLNFKNYILIDLLAQMELIKKDNLLKGNTELNLLISEMETYFNQDFFLINSISIIKPEKNISLNRAEFLFIIKEPNYEKFEDISKSDIEKLIWNDIINIHLIMLELQKTHNIKLDYLILKESEFFELIKEKEHNTLKDIILHQTTFLYPQNYWLEIKKLYDEGMNIEKVEEINPAKIKEIELIYNLSRFGYKEFGSEIKQKKDICLELIITSILLKGDARRIESIPILLRKKTRGDGRPIYYNLLIFLSMKYKTAGKLLGFLKILNKSLPDRESRNAIKIIEKIGICAEKVDKAAINRKMRLYYEDWKR